jgi:hypothetical protein
MTTEEEEEIKTIFYGLFALKARQREREKETAQKQRKVRVF